MNDKGERATPPHLAFTTFLGGLETLDQGLPQKLDRTAWPSQSGTNQAQLLRALRFFHLTDGDDQVQRSLDELIVAKADRKGHLRTLLEAAYPKLVSLGGANATQQQLQDAVGEFGIDGATRRKAMTFYLQAADYAEIPVSTHWPAIKKRGTSGAKKRAGGSKRSAGSSSPAGSKPPAGDTKIVTLKSGGTVTLNISVSIMSLSAEDREWVFDLIDMLGKYESDA